jgi:hypothetical protein
MATPPTGQADELEFVLDDLDGRSAGKAILADDGALTRRSLRARLWGHGPFPYGGVIVLLLALLLGIAPSARDGLPATVDLGGARLARAGMAHALYIEPGVPWAVVSVDGRWLPRIPRYGDASALYLSPGTHQVEWRAAPFDTLTCTLSQPGSPSDTCAHGEVVDGSTPGIIATIVAFDPSLTSLSGRRRSELVADIQSVLDSQTSSETVQPGERYVDAAGSPPAAAWAHAPVAQAPLLATLRLKLVSDLDGAQTCHIDYSESCAPVGQDCRFLCTLSEAAPGTMWQVLAIVRGLWTFATPDGHTIIADAPDGLAGAGTGVILRLKWTGEAWQVALSYFQPSIPGPGYILPTQLGGYPGCTWLLTELDAQVFAPHSGDVSQQLAWHVASGPPGAAGCLAIGTGAGAAPASVGAPLQGAYLLQRFGIILAANDAAHQRWPYLPLASPYARQLAATIAATRFPRA